MDSQRKNFALDNALEGKKISLCSETMQDFEEGTAYKLNDMEIYHRNKAEALGLPEWVLNIECPKCQKKITPEGFRSFELKLNSKNFGDLCVEFLCVECSLVDRYYYKEGVDSIDTLIEYLKGRSPETEPMNEITMHNDKRNNISDQWYLSKKGEGNDPV